MRSRITPAQRLPAADFFAAPPPEIGELVSADTTLRTHKNPLGWGTRISIGASLVVIIIGVAFWIASGQRRPADRTAFQVIGALIALGVFGIAIYVTRFKAVCSYVGKNGMARFTLHGSRESIPSTELLLFNTVSELHSSQTRHFYNGVYTGTNYVYTWNDPNGVVRLKLSGTYRGKDSPPKQGDAWFLAESGERAWSLYFLEHANKQLQHLGFIEFAVDRKRRLRIGPGFIEFHFVRSPRVEAQDMAAISLSGGQFSFKHKDAKWYSFSGKYSFEYGAMANARVFLMALDSL
ncbi:MAG: hypothetical protein QM811_08855, partial [Pirellulales bacterium]